MSSAFDLLEGETPLERTKMALRQAACFVAFRRDVDPMSLYDVRGANEETYVRHIWLWLTRTALDIKEADIAAALTAVLIDLGLRVLPGSEPEPEFERPQRRPRESAAAFRERVIEAEDEHKKARTAWRLRNSAVHHDTIANACRHIEELMSDAEFAAEMEDMAADLIKGFAGNRRFREVMDKAEKELRQSRMRQRRSQ